MARGRFISATLGGSRKFARLANDTHRMIYVLLIPSADAYGRVDVDPVTLSGRVLTRLSISPDVVSAALADMHNVGLIHLYDVGEDHYAEITNFHEHNDIDLSREAQGEIPDARGVLPPEKPPRGTKRADADPRVWSGEYVAANVHPEAAPSAAAQADSAPVLPLSRPAPDNGGQRQSNPSAIRHEVEVEVEGEVEDKDMSARADNPPTFLETLISTWNDQCGDLRRVRDTPAALKDPNLTRLATALHRRHAARALEIFTAGIAAVRADPHWLGGKATKPTRQGAAYGIQNYLRHVETKAEEAADLHETTARRGIHEGDRVKHKPTGEIGEVLGRFNDGTITINGRDYRPTEEFEPWTN